MVFGWQAVLLWRLIALFWTRVLVQIQRSEIVQKLKGKHLWMHSEPQRAKRGTKLGHTILFIFLPQVYDHVMNLNFCTWPSGWSLAGKPRNEKTNFAELAWNIVPQNLLLFLSIIYFLFQFQSPINKSTCRTRWTSILWRKWSGQIRNLHIYEQI